MSVVSKFLGKPVHFIALILLMAACSTPEEVKRPMKDSPSKSMLTANPKIEDPLSLQVLFSEYVPIEAKRLIEEFKAYHPSMSKVRCDLDAALAKEGKIFGLIGWDEHVIKIVGFDLPMPAEAVEQCIAPSHYGPELKAEARAHKAHILLYYAGYDESPLEQYVALAATAGVLANFGAIVVLNESGHTSFPAAALSKTETGDDMLELLRTLPRPILYCGFVKHEVEGVPGVWMRTYGAPLLGLPELAAHAAGHHEGEYYFDIFNSIFTYVEDSGASFASGHTMQIDEDAYLRFRSPSSDESFFEGESELLILEKIGADQINRQ